MSDVKKILIVDDEVSLLNLCQIILEEAGFLVRAAVSGRQALKMLIDYQPDLVLLDVMMPGMSGIELCRRIREELTERHPRIVMFTADERATTREDSFAAGADHFLSKESAIFDLPAHVTRCLV